MVGYTRSMRYDGIINTTSSVGGPTYCRDQGLRHGSLLAVMYDQHSRNIAKNRSCPFRTLARAKSANHGLHGTDEV